MGRKSHSQELSLWANGEHVGRWVLPPRGDMELHYDPQWVASPRGRPLSLSLPMMAHHPVKGAVVANYFDNLLPDSEAIRKRLAQRFKTDTVEPFDLLKAIGRDCVGAIQLLGADESPGDVRRIDGTPLTDAQIEQLLAQTVSGGPLAHAEGADDDELRISLAGAQEKTALLWHNNAWLRPHGTTPTTHILKLPLGLIGNRRADFGTSVENEWLCMQLLAAFGLPVAETAIVQFGAQKALSVKRFDRQLDPSGTWLMRLPQEDFCQALGVAPHLKYESDGGPGLAALARVLSASQNSDQDLLTLLKAQVLFWLLAAPDGHAKNFSLRILPGQQRYALTPLYDVMSIWPVEGGGPSQFSWHKAKLAMALEGKNRHFHFSNVQRRHFVHTAARHFLGLDADRVITEVLTLVTPAIERVRAILPATFPEQVASRIFTNLQAQADQLARMPSR